MILSITGLGRSGTTKATRHRSRGVSVENFDEGSCSGVNMLNQYLFNILWKSASHMFSFMLSISLAVVTRPTVCVSSAVVISIIQVSRVSWRQVVQIFPQTALGHYSIYSPLFTVSPIIIGHQSISLPNHAEGIVPKNG